LRAEVPFRLVGGEQPLIVVSARFNGSGPIDCALDTGASHAILLPEEAARVRISLEAARQAEGAAGPIEVRTGRADSIALGDAVARDVPVLVTSDLARISEAIGLRLGGNIGYSFLERFRVTVDYQEQRLILSSPDEPAPTHAARAALPFTLAHPSKPLILLPVRVHDRPYQFALDTGASTTVISPAVARECRVETRAMPGMTGGGGVVAASAAVLDSLEIDRVRVSRVRVAVAEFLEPLGQAIGARLDGIIGTNVLRRFRVTVDYPAKQLRLD
jgi:predicted aspartyl protease